MKIRLQMTKRQIKGNEIVTEITHHKKKLHSIRYTKDKII